MVSIWLTTVKTSRESSAWKKSASQGETDFHQIFRIPGALLAILLDAGGPQPGQTMLIDGKLPGEEFVDRQRITAASLLKGEQAAANRGHDFRLAADDPTFGSGRGQIRNC